jgi:membrane protease YdiL (CAAX protease family)
MPSDDPWYPHPGDELPPPEAIYRPPTEFRQGPPGLPPVLEAQPARPPHPGFWFSLLWCLGYLAATQGPALVVGVVAMVVVMIADPTAFGQGQEGGSPKALMESPAFAALLAVIAVVSEVFKNGVAWLVLRLVVGRDWARQVALRRPGLAHVVLVVLAMPAVVLLFNGFYVYLRQVVGVRGFSDWGLGGMEELMKAMSRWPTAFGVLVIGLSPGVSEELWCRGFLGRGLVARYGVYGVVLTSFFFGLIHLDPPQALYAMAAGLWLHFVYLTTRSLFVPMLVHALNNSLSVIGTHVEALQALDSEVGKMPLYVFAGAAALLLGVGYALYQSRARLAPAAGHGPVLWLPLYPGVEYPPPGRGTIVAHPRPSLTALTAACAGFLAFLACCWLAYTQG